jgi:hypothetical protein
VDSEQSVHTGLFAACFGPPWFSRVGDDDKPVSSIIAAMENTQMIEHSVAFRLGDDADADAFWARVEALADIGGVQRFKKLRQIGLKNDFTHALSM